MVPPWIYEHVLEATIAIVGVLVPLLIVYSLFFD